MLFVALETVALCFMLWLPTTENPPNLGGGNQVFDFRRFEFISATFGIVLIYGVASSPEVWELTKIIITGSLSFSYLSGFLAENQENLILRPESFWFLRHCLQGGSCPFQIWVPRLSWLSLPITAFLAVSSKAAGFSFC